MAATYDPTTDVGLVRLMIAETDVTTTVFTDAEVQAAIDREGNLELSGAFLLRSLAADKAKIAVVVSRGSVGRAGGVSEDLSKIAEAILETADRLRDEGLAAGDESSGTALEAVITPSYSYRDYERNVLLGREGIVR